MKIRKTGFDGNDYTVEYSGAKVSVLSCMKYVFIKNAFSIVFLMTLFTFMIIRGMK